MGIPGSVLRHQAHQLQHLINLLGDDLVVPLALNDQALGDDLLDGHTGVQRGDGVLENHLDLSDQLGLLRLAQLIFVLGLQLGLLLAGCLGNQRLVLFPNLGSTLAGIGLVAVFLVGISLLHQAALLGNGLVHLRLQGCGIFGVLLGSSLVVLLCLFNGVLVRLLTGGNADSLEEYAAGGNVIELDDGPAGGGLAAAGLAYQAEDLALFDLKADIVHSLGGTEVLAQMVHSQQGFLVLILHLRHLRSFLSFCGYGLQ